MSYIEISNPGGIADKELGASLTGSTTLVKSSKDVLGGNKVIIDFGMHQGSENANELNKLLDNKTVDIVDFYYFLDDLEKNNKKVNRLILLNEKLKNKNNLKQIEENNKNISDLVSSSIDLIFQLSDLYSNLDSENLLKLFNNNKENLNIFFSELNKQKALFSNKKELLNNIEKNIVEKNSIHNNDSLKKIFKKNIDENILKNYITIKNDGEDLINADVLIITHAHMDHIGRVPQLVKAGFKGRIIMSPFTKALSKYMWTDYINVIQRDIEKIEHGNKKKTNILKNYITMLNIDIKLSKNNLTKEEKESLELKKEKILDGKKIEDFEKNSKSFLGSIGTDIEIIKLFSKNEADSLVNINNKINEIYNKRNSRDKNFFNDLKESLEKAKIYYDLNDYELLEKEKIKISYYPTESNKLKESLIKDSIEYKILDSIDYEKNYKSTSHKEETKELKILNEKVKKIIKGKDLDLCLLYANKILGNNDYDKLKSKVPELLYDINDVYKAYEMIETLDVGHEINLDSRIVITKSDSNVIDKIPKIIEDGYNKPIYVLPGLKQQVINSWFSEYNETVELNSRNKEIRDNYTKFKKFIDNYNRSKNKLNLKTPEGYNATEYYEFCMEELKSNEKFIFENEIDEALGFKKIIESSYKYDSVKNLSNNELTEELKNLENDINNKQNLLIEGIKLKDLSLFYKQNKRNIKNKKYYNSISTFISKNKIKSIDEFIIFVNKSNDLNHLLTKNKKHSKKSQLNTIYNNYILYINNSEYIDALENTEILFENERELNVLYSKSSTLKNKSKLLDDYKDYKILEKVYLKKTKFLDEYNIDSNGNKNTIINGLFENKKLKYTKKQIQEAISKLEIILEKDNEKIVESLKLTFYNAGHIEGSVMISLSYIIKEVKSNINGILTYGADNFCGHKEIKKSFKNLLFSGDIGKITQPNISGVPDIPDYKYDYTQLESTYADREHPDKQKEFERLIKILNRPGRKLGATFALQRTQEPPVEILTLLKNNLNNKKELEKLYSKRRVINSEYKKFKLSKNKAKIEQKFLELSQVNLKIENINKNYYAGTILLDSPSASKITDEFIENFPEKYKILDPMIQKQLFGKEKFRVLGPGESEKLYKTGKKYENFFLLSSGGMIQGGMIINHLKELVSDPEATVILFGYVAEGTLGRKLLNGDKEIIIDGEKFDVKCKVESIGGFSSHMGQGDLVIFGGKLLNYSKNAILSLTHGDEARGVLKKLISGVNSKIEIIIPKLGDKLRMKL